MKIKTEILMAGENYCSLCGKVVERFNDRSENGNHESCEKCFTCLFSGRREGEDHCVNWNIKIDNPQKDTCDEWFDDNELAQEQTIIVLPEKL